MYLRSRRAPTTGRMPRTRYDLAPAVPVQQPVDGRAGHLLAHPLAVGLLQLGHCQHPVVAGPLHERSKQLLLLFGREVLVVSAATPAHVEDRLALLGPARVHDVHGGRRPAQQLRDLAGRAAQRRPDQHALVRWYSERLLARLSLSARRPTVALSPTIRSFIHGPLKSADVHDIQSIERDLVSDVHLDGVAVQLHQLAARRGFALAHQLGQRLHRGVEAGQAVGHRQQAARLRVQRRFP